MSDFVPYDRVIVLALDSVTWDLLLPFASDSTMPALGALLRSSHYGVLESALPPHTAAAWTTFLTGQDPGHHGIIDFVSFDPVRHRFRFHDSSLSRKLGILPWLSNAGVSCGSLFLPRHYPPFSLPGGYIVSGFETPGVECRFTEPQELREEVLGISPQLHFNFEDDWEDDTDEAAFSRNIERAMNSVDLLERLAVHFQRERPVQMQIAYLQATDILFHKAWKWCDPRTGDSNPLRHELAKRFFRRTDQLINRVMGVHSSSRTSQRFRTDGPRTLRVLVSDHGHGCSRGRVFVNNLLKEWGFLQPISRLRAASRKLALLTMDRSTRKAKHHELPLDWSRTQAYLAHVGIYGFLYINLKGREERGIVPPEKYDEVRNTLIGKFLAARIPGTDEPLFPKVLKGEEAYARKHELNLPDLILVPADGYFPRKKLTRGPSVRPSPNSASGVHRVEGVYAFSGPGIVCSPGLGSRANIADIAPTLLAALGQPIPKDMTGQPMLHLFQQPPVPRYVSRDEADASRSVPALAGETYSHDEEKALEKRLSDLGYLE